MTDTVSQSCRARGDDQSLGTRWTLWTQWTDCPPRPYLVVALAVGLAFANSLLNGWTFDDHYVIAKNPIFHQVQPDESVQSVQPFRFPGSLGVLFSRDYFILTTEGSYRPVATASYFLDASIWGVRPAGFHLANVLLHAGAALLLLGRLRRMGLSGMAALGGALVFALHPGVCEAVNGVGFREDLLVGFLGLMAWTMMDEWGFPAKPAARWSALIAVGVSLFLAQMSKESAVIWPVWFAALAWLGLLPIQRHSLSSSSSSPSENGHPVPTVRPDSPSPPPIQDDTTPSARCGGWAGLKASWGLLAVAFVVVGAGAAIQMVLFTNPAKPVLPWAWGSWPVAWLGAPRLIARYIALVFFPLHLSAEYPPLPAPSSLFAFGAVGLTTGGFILWLSAWLLASRQRIVGGWLLFLLPLVPVSGLIPIAQPFAERFLYVPLIGVGWMAAEGIEWLRARARQWSHFAMAPLLLAAVGVLALAALGARTAVRNTDWIDNETLFAPVAQTNAASTRGLQALGARYVREKQYEAAAGCFRRVIELKPDSPDAHFQLGFVLGALGDNAGAAEASRQATVLWPEFADAHLNAAIFYLRMNPPDKTKAAEHLNALERLGVAPPQELVEKAGN